MKTNSKNYNREISSSALAFRSMLSGYFFLFIFYIHIILYTFFFSFTALLFYKRARLFYAVIKCITLETLSKHKN